ncbi:hypothetical protein VTK73DRAFT_106 [Phialemonium thermophilum]|uniref:Polycomb protein VEFS-Box domain-containing protein n=1 Tax=Phialemonium thermophilum TaxID=223376 RepID=A0ABR3Y523_9PEZI
MSNLNWRSRRLPYLHRNWMTAVTHLQALGVKLSSSSLQTSDRIADHEDDTYHRPAKRRRLAEGPHPLDQAGLDELAGFLLPGDHAKLEKALRIEILKIDHKNSSRVKFNGILNGLIPPQVKDVADSKARCRISIFYDTDGERVLLYSDSQICTIKTFKNPVGPSYTSRIYMPTPFHIPQEKILVEREGGEVFGLADSYSVVIELESAGDPTWLPRNISPNPDEAAFCDRRPVSGQWFLTGSISEIFSHNRKAVALRLKRRKPPQDLPIDYVLDVDVRWTSALSSSRMLKRLEKDVLPSITVVDPSESAPPPVVANGTNVRTSVNGVEIVNGVNGQVNGHGQDGPPTPNGHINGDVLDDMDEQAEGELTPSRSRRAKHQINYNLKLLSDQAAGKERRRRRKAGEKLDFTDDYRITYLLPPEQISVDDFSCCLCAAPHQCLSQLRAHLLGHEKYQFDIDLRPKGGYQISVSHSSSGPATPMRRQVYQLGLPLKAFNLEKYIEGDNSWVTSRLGPDDGRDLGPPKTVPPKVTQAPDAKRNRGKTYLVPHIKQPLYHPLSKVRLEPGSEIRPYIADDSWLVHKHSSTLQEFVDVEVDEKEYIKVWDEFIAKHRISSDQYFPRAFLGFVRDKADWIIAKPSRAEEFSKHILVLYTRGSIDEILMHTAMEILEKAKAEQSEEELTDSPKEKSNSGCAVCGQLVSGPSLLTCSELKCRTPLYHDKCVKDPQIPIENRDFWKCNNCATELKAAKRE